MLGEGYFIFIFKLFVSITFSEINYRLTFLFMNTCDRAFRMKICINIMKYPVRELFIPLLMVLEFMFSSPLFSSSQSKVLKLKVENQAIGLPVTRNYSQKLVKTISIYGSRGLDELITFDYDAKIEYPL